MRNFKDINTSQTGTLYVVATPIGNLEDITFRAINVLKQVDLILAEDTRVTGKLLKHYDIDNHIKSYHAHTSDTKKAEILNLLLQGKNIALVTDAGTPGISDPGNELIDYLLNNYPDLKTIPIPGASAITTALSISGFHTNQFVFLGFLPKKKRTKLFKWLKEGKTTFAFYESPNRILKSLEVVKQEFGEVRIVVARELTKIHETIYRGSVTDVIGKLQNDTVKGEIVVIIENY